MKKCNNCNYEWNDDRTFCIRCGQKWTGLQEDEKKMICRNCGAELKEGDLFCGKCGAKVGAPDPVCPSCGGKVTDGAKFCSKCGTNLANQPKHCTNCGAELAPDAKFCSSCGQMVGNGTYSFTDAETSNRYNADSQKSVQANSQFAFPIRANMVSFYENNSIVYKSTGYLECYEDRILYNIKMGGPLGASFGLVGMVVSAHNAKKDSAVKEYYFSDIAQINKSAYGLGTAITLVYNDGNSVKFAGTGVSNQFDQMMTVFSNYKNVIS